MSVSNQTVSQLYQGNGSNTSFAIPFAYISGDLDDIDVFTVDVDGVKSAALTRGSDYTLTPAGDDPTTVEFTVAPGATTKVLVERSLEFTQIVSYAGRYSASQQETAVDRIVLMIQQLYNMVRYAPFLNILDRATFNQELPLMEADKLLAVNASADGWTFADVADLEGPQGPPGEAGPAGAAGRNILSGSAAPGVSTGSEGDLYLRTATGVLYGPKTADPTTPWSQTLSLVGPTGPTGPNYGVSLFGTRAAPKSIVLANGLTTGGGDFDATVIDQLVFVKGPALGENLVTADPQIEHGQIVGQRIRICCPIGATNWLRFECQERGIRGNGPVILDEDGKAAEFFWDGVDWCLISGGPT